MAQAPWPHHPPHPPVSMPSSSSSCCSCISSPDAWMEGGPDSVTRARARAAALPWGGGSSTTVMVRKASLSLSRASSQSWGEGRGSRGGGDGLAPPELCDYQEPEEGMSTPGTMVFSAVKDGKLVKQCNKIKLGNIVYYQKRESDGIDGQYVEGDYDKAFFCNNVVGVKNCSRFGQVCLTNNNRYIDEYTHNQVDGDPTCDPLGAT